jgi:hypothetical protein
VLESDPHKGPQAWHHDDLQHVEKDPAFVKDPNLRSMSSFVGLTDGAKLDKKPSSSPFKNYDTIIYNKGDILIIPVTRLHRGCGNYKNRNYRLYLFILKIEKEKQ